MLITLYFCLIVLFYLLFFVPVFIISFCKQKYKKSLKARFFLYKNKKIPPCDIHFHACSFGEINALEQIIKLLKDEYKINITTITQTGFDKAKTITKNVAFLPFEIFLPFWFSRCRILIVFEAEFWLILFLIAKLKGAKIVLLNARISDKSVKKYQKFAFFYKKIFSYVDFVYAQSDIDKIRLEGLGAKNISVCGNLKLNYHPNFNCLKTLNKKFCVIASTHLGEEEKLLFGVLNNKYFDDFHIILAPRHPERFNAVLTQCKAICDEFGVSFSNYLEQNDGYLHSKVFLLNALGVLNDFYAISSVVFLGGSFVDKIGGHNALEPAFFNNKIVSGKYIFNQKELYSYVENIFFANIDEIDSIDISCIKNSYIKQKISSFNHEDLIKLLKKDKNERKSL